MKNYFELVPGDARHYQLVPGNDEHYRIIPTQQSSQYELISARRPQFTLLKKRHHPPRRLERRDRQKLRRQNSEIRQVTAASKHAIDQISSLYLYAEKRFLHTLAAAETMQRQYELTEESAHVMIGIHQFLTGCYVRRILTLFSTKSKTVLANIAQHHSANKGDNDETLHRD